jgi:microcystin-dependent protein
MSTPFLAEMKFISWNFSPKGWAFCSGQLLPINQNQPLFSLLGTTYGGDGRVNFALPDLRGRVPIHVGSGFTEGQRGGELAHTVTMSEMPAHNHFVNATNVAGTATTPAANFFANSNVTPYRTDFNTTLNPQTVTNIGGSQAHQNMQPYLVLNVIIALVGIFPSQT